MDLENLNLNLDLEGNLNLEGNLLRGPSVMEALGKALSSEGGPRVRTLNLRGNALEPSGVQALMEAFSSLTQQQQQQEEEQALPLESLDLSRTKARVGGVKALAEAMKAKKLTSLRTLDLHGNDVRSEGTRHLASAVNAGGVPNLRVLVLRETGLTHVNGGGYSVRGERDFSPLSELLSTTSLPELEEFDLSSNYLFRVTQQAAEGAGGGADPASRTPVSPDVFLSKRFPKLRKLLLDGNCMSDGQLELFFGELGRDGAPSLEELVLFGTTETAERFSNAITSSHLPQLRRLQMRMDIPVGRGQSRELLRTRNQASAINLARSLTSGNTRHLQSLDLQGLSFVSDGSLLALAEGIRGGGLSLLENLVFDPLGGLEDTLDDIPGDFLHRIGVRRVNGHSVSALGGALGGGGCPSLSKLRLGW